MQMVTTGGANTHVIAVNGNFDDAQTGVKRIFSDRAFAETMDAQGRVPVSYTHLSTKMRSCLWESLRVEDGQVQMSGKGYGHGVGMSQWGAYAMAKEGRTAEEIVTHYFNGVSIDQAWE